MIIQGNAWKYGRDIDTDVIIPARYLTTTDEKELGKHCLEDLDRDFVKKISKGDILVAGENFGCGSSREHAPLAIKGAGVSLVVASSFARIFFRNAINMGLPILESKEAVEDIQNGDRLTVNLANGKIINERSGAEFQVQPYPEFLQGIIESGGLLEVTKKRIMLKGKEHV
jgi:3-isopropylmalate/(R)-2-methylmalate dehydratase small subunit